MVTRSRTQRVSLILGAVLAAVAFVWLVRALHPDLGIGKAESTWAPEGLRGLFTARGFLAVVMAVASLTLLILAFRPGRRASPSTFFSREEKWTIQQAIARAEERTSGEIRVHLARFTHGDVLEAAKAVFQTIGMHATKARNGVLIYLSVEDHRFAIVGDAGIDGVVPAGFWDEIKAGMQERFAADRFAEGIAEAVRQVGEKLQTYFPIEKGDINELTDDISTEP